MPLFALVDANSFYASCEIAFQPGLENHPVVVLSNNDGCIVAANKIAKDLANQQHVNYGQGGYRAAKPTSMMFQPYFKLKGFLARHNTVVFSSNYELYADMSTRMHRLVAEFGSAQEIYSIDESFLDLSGMAHWNLTHYGQQIKQRVKQGLGLPIAIGIAPSKTLAKLANHLAKKLEGYDGVLDLSALSEVSLNLLLKNLSVREIWGIGKQLATQLEASGIQSALDLKLANPNLLKRRSSIIERIIMELNGIACLQLEQVAPAKQQILSSRSFGRPIRHYQEMEQAVASYTARAAEKLRSQNSVCQTLNVYIRTDPFNPPAYTRHQTLGLVYSSDNTSLLVQMAKRALKRIWQPGLVYQKAGITLSEISPKGALQLDVFAPNPKYSANAKSDTLMQVLDEVNRKMGRGKLHLAAEGLVNRQDWRMRRDYCSPRYTTRWDELLTVR
ncbi:Y-family DNA polymerase [Thiomicrospira sp.]|uniref:Y-family DNA polymerase n=1 Tax=Thiomicrospira sp. TaxID=935 RepID=UPI002F93BB5C